jgi:inward rectifier potassium channel
VAETNDPKDQPVTLEPDIRDLGFGSVVSQEQQTRLLNRDGSFNVFRRGLGFWKQLNIYHALLTMRWWKFNILLVAGYLTFNLAFALAYYACGPGALRGDETRNPFFQALFFSIETYSTIGYGNIIPTTRIANVLVGVEAFMGFVSFAMTTGLLFARFSRPTAAIIYSKNAIIAPYFNRTAFEFRITNARQNQIIDLTARVVLSRFERVDGHMQRRYHALKLERETVAFFPLAWTVVHPIDLDSPMYGWDQQMLQESAAEFLVLLTGTDETVAQIVHSRTSYAANEILWNVRFVSLYEDSSKGVAINVNKLHEVHPAADLKQKATVQ